MKCITSRPSPSKKSQSFNLPNNFRMHTQSRRQTCFGRSSHKPATPHYTLHPLIKEENPWQQLRVSRHFALCKRSIACESGTSPLEQRKLKNLMSGVNTIRNVKYGTRAVKRFVPWVERARGLDHEFERVRLLLISNLLYTKTPFIVFTL